MSTRARVAGLLVVVGVVLAACGGGSDTKTVDVQLTDYEITANALSVPAGATDFAVRNDGGLQHEFAVVRTTLDAGALPTLPDGMADEHAAGVHVVDRLQLAPGATGDLEVDLQAGHYALVCNLPPDAAAGTPAHYARRMYANLEVTE